MEVPASTAPSVERMAPPSRDPTQSLFRAVRRCNSTNLLTTFMLGSCIVFLVMKIKTMDERMRHLEENRCMRQPKVRHQVDEGKSSPKPKEEEVIVEEEEEEEEELEEEGEEEEEEEEEEDAPPPQEVPAPPPNSQERPRRAKK